MTEQEAKSILRTRESQVSHVKTQAAEAAKQAKSLEGKLENKLSQATREELAAISVVADELVLQLANSRVWGLVSKSSPYEDWNFEKCLTYSEAIEAKGDNSDAYIVLNLNFGFLKERKIGQ